MENNRYRNINELLNEIESLGDWRDVSQRDKFFKVLSKITVIYHGYELEDESGKKSKEWYPDEVMQAIVKACKGKFPIKEQVFDKDGHLKPGYPDYSNYLVLVNDALSISLMGERTRIDEIAKNEFGIDVYHTPATKEEVDEMVQSSKEYYEKVINEEKQNAVQIEFYGSTLDECVESLLKFQKRGESVVVDFNGHKLYSADISMDVAYKEVLGMTKEEHEQKMEEWHKEYEEREAREKAEAQAKIPSWIERGEALIYPERMEKWKECVEARAGDLYHGMDLDSALELMEKLDSGATIEEVKEIFDKQGHSGASAGMVRSILFHFSKRGPEFYESTAWRELTEDDKKVIEDKKRENAEIENGTHEKELTYEERKKIAESRIPEWIEKGAAIISPDKREAWKKHVESKARGMFLGLSLDEEIELMERLKNGESFESLTKIIEDDKTRTYIGAVNGVLRFSEMGPEFTEYFEKAIGEYTPEMAKAIEKVRAENAERNKAEETQISEEPEVSEKTDKIAEQKASAIPVDINYRYGNTIESAVRTLEDYRDRGESVVIDFNGHKLYSCDVTMDSAYMEITGKTKAEFDEAQAKWRQEYHEREAREKAEAEAQIPSWIEKGEAFIYPERMEKWKECVEARAGDLYHGMDLDSALALMEKLESGATIEEVKEMFDEQGHSGASAGMVRSILFHFSKRGPEFYESTAWGELSEEDKKVIEDKKRENAELAELHKTDSTKEIPPERKQAEEELTELSAKKEQLTAEIDDIEQQLEELRAKEAELKKSLSAKQTELKGLEEK